MLPHIFHIERPTACEKIFSMSDHWNGIANLLGTPSLNPIGKKSDSSKSQKPAVVFEQLPQVEEAHTEPVILEAELSNAKPEPSRLRSSWDAVAQFFGVSSPEPPQQSTTRASDLPSDPSDSETKQFGAPSRKSKPSMWGVSDEPMVKKDTSVEVNDSRPPAREVRDPRAFRESPTRESGSRINTQERSTRSDEAPPPSRRESNELEVGPGFGEPKSRRATSQTSRSEANETPNSDRRSTRRPPRRGRSAADESIPVDEPSVAPAFDIDEPFGFGVEKSSDDRLEPVRSPSSRGGRGRGSRDSSRDVEPRALDRSESPEIGERPARTDRPERGERPERGPRPEQSDRPIRQERANRTERSDIPEKTDRPERAERTDRPDRATRSERPERVSRPERTDRPDRASRPERPESSDRAPRPERPEVSDRASRPERAPNRGRSPRDDRSGRDSNVREPSARDERRDMPAHSKSIPKPTGFGAGLHDDDDDFGFRDDPILLEKDGFVLIDDDDPDASGSEIEVKDLDDREARPKRRRGRGRGRRSGRVGDEKGERSESGIESDGDEDGGEVVSRNTKIPSWQDAIGTLVATNMENHQRTQSHSRNSRGRGPRRDR